MTQRFTEKNQTGFYYLIGVWRFLSSPKDAQPGKAVLRLAADLKFAKVAYLIHRSIGQEVWSQEPVCQ